MQAEQQPEYPLLYSLRGFQYCDLLLGDAERYGVGHVVGAPASRPRTELKAAPPLDALREVEQRAAQTLKWAEARGFRS